MKNYVSTLVIGMVISVPCFAGDRGHSNDNDMRNVNNTHINSHVKNVSNDVVKNTNTNSNTNEINASSLSLSSASGGSADANADSNSVSISESGDGGSATINNNSRRIPVSTAYSSSLTSGLDTCMGSASAGVQTGIVGVSGGKTYVDQNCVMIKQVQLLSQMGLPDAACFRARMGDEGKAIDEAMSAAGVDCKGLKPVFETVDFVSKAELRQHEDVIVKKLSSK